MKLFFAAVPFYCFVNGEKQMSKMIIREMLKKQLVRYPNDSWCTFSSELITKSLLTCFIF